MENDREHGERVAGRIVFEAEAVGIAGLVLAAVAIFELDGAAQWYAAAGFLAASALAFGLLANAVLRR